jgi:hypothetical protein
MEARTLDRREFTVASALALLSGVTITITACGGSGGDPGYAAPPTSPTGGADANGNVTGAISTNHGHVATVTSAQLAAGSGFVLNIQGQADHAQSVELSATDLGQIASGVLVTKTSSTASTDGHRHTVLFSSSGSYPAGPEY